MRRVLASRSRRWRADPSSGPSGHLPPQGGKGLSHDPPRPPLRRTRGDDEFFVSSRRLASGGTRGARGGSGPDGDRDRRSQHARRRRARACLRPREPRRDRAFTRRHGSAARLHRRRARRARLSPGSRRLWAPVPAADQGKPARAEGGVPSEFRGSARACGGVAGRGDAPRPSSGRYAATFSRKSGRREGNPSPVYGRGVGARALFSLGSARPSATAFGSGRA